MRFRHAFDGQPGRGQHVSQQRHHEQHTNLPHRGRQPEQRRPARQLNEPRPPPRARVLSPSGLLRGCDGWPRPEQKSHGGDDQGFEQDVWHDRLLGLDLVGVEQDRRGGERRQPAAGAVPDRQRVQAGRHRQAEHVLGDRHPGQAAADPKYWAKQQVGIAERIEAALVTAQVAGRVDVDEGRPVGNGGGGAQRHPRGEQDRERPVPPHHRPPGHEGIVNPACPATHLPQPPGDRRPAARTGRPARTPIAISSCP